MPITLKEFLKLLSIGNVVVKFMNDPQNPKSDYEVVLTAVAFDFEIKTIFPSYAYVRYADYYLEHIYQNLTDNYMEVYLDNEKQKDD